MREHKKPCGQMHLVGIRIVVIHRKKQSISYPLMRIPHTFKASFEMNTCRREDSAQTPAQCDELRRRMRQTLLHEGIDGNQLGLSLGTCPLVLDEQYPPVEAYNRVLG